MGEKFRLFRKDKKINTGWQSFAPGFILTAFVFVFFFSGIAAGIDRDKLTHLNQSKVAHGCGACHDASGRGKAGMMLRDRPEEVCLGCHGLSGRQSYKSKSDIYSLLTKKSNHPIFNTAKYHMQNEELPEKNTSIPRHVSCLDCHNPHMSRPENPLAWAKGTDYTGHKKPKAEKQSEVCYDCHADSVNRPLKSHNIRLQFDPANRSYHPVERVSRGRSPSLLKRIGQGNYIVCADCHEPHGSDYPPLLRLSYNLSDGGESPYAYQLCYSCHDRNNILSNASFRGSPTRDYGHKEHIVYQQTSCHTCHTAHGSAMNLKLIEFDDTVVTGMRQYMDYRGGRAQCNLICHGKAHNN